MNNRTSPMFICKIDDGESEYKLELSLSHKLKLVKKTGCKVIKEKREANNE